MKYLIITLLLLGIHFVGAYDFELVAQETRFEFVEGYETNAFLFNNEYPGPLIRGVEGETIAVKVHNNLSVPTSIHWHGLKVHNMFDGVPEVTQEPIMPGEEFVYELNLSLPGVYWYHSHFDTNKQVEKGLKGPIIIEKKDDPYKHIPEKVLFLDDVLIDNGYFASFNIGLVHGRFGNNYVLNGENFLEMNLPKGYSRLRLINGANARTFNLRFDDAHVAVIGENIGFLPEPYEAQTVTVTPSDRKDILIYSEGESASIVHEHITGDVDLGSISFGEEEVEHVRLEGFEDEITSFSPHYEDVDFEVRLRGDMVGGQVTWMINDKHNREGLDNVEIFELNKNRLYIGKIINTQGEPHPMHMHGQVMLPLKRNDDGVDEFWTDTIYVNGGETVEFAILPDNKGDWAFHCHTLEHAKAGMTSLVRVV